MAAGIQRPLRGSRISTFYPIKTLPSLSSLDSAFQLQEYISLLIRLDIHDVDAITSLPSKGVEGDEKDAAEKGVVVDEACWVYEQLRRLAQDLTHPLITTLQQECTRTSCPEMKAGEWLYLCVAHGNEGSMEQCCAIDYILHTLDSATALLSSPRTFPSRLQIPPTSHRHFASLARRLGRIFAHAYFHHREAFEQAEVESSLYARFLALAGKFELVPPEFLPIPPEAFHLHAQEEVEPPRVLHPPTASNTSTTAESPVESHEPEAAAPPPPLDTTTLAVPPPGLAAAPEGSPRRVGRNRTDTMVPSEATAIIEELAARAAEAPAELSLSEEDVSIGGEEAPATAKPTATSSEAGAESAGNDEAEEDDEEDDEDEEEDEEGEEEEEEEAEEVKKAGEEAKSDPEQAPPTFAEIAAAAAPATSTEDAPPTESTITPEAEAPEDPTKTEEAAKEPAVAAAEGGEETKEEKAEETPAPAAIASPEAEDDKAKKEEDKKVDA